MDIHQDGNQIEAPPKNINFGATIGPAQISSFIDHRKFLMNEQ